MYAFSAILIGMMITFCLGSARAKRAYIKTVKNALLLDNTEVLFCASENGRNYFAYAPVPFGEFSVFDYLCYRRALCGQKLDHGDIKKFGINPKKKIGRLCAAELRIVMFLEKTCGSTDRPVIINLDGARYGKRCLSALRRLIDVLPEAYVFVTDARFEKRFRGKHGVMTFGSQSKSLSHRFYAAKALAKRIGATRVSVM